jgi:hypothetical protein
MTAAWADLCPGCLHPWWAHPSERYGRRPPQCTGSGCQCTEEMP